jgi:RNA polymerase sigma-70 factor, ECF subfamily
VSAIGGIVSGPLCDAALISEAQIGNHSAFEELCRRYSNTLMRRIRRVMRDHSDAEDVLQETLLSAFTHLKSFEGRSSVSTWMTRIAINAALSRLRKNQRLTISIDEVGEETGPALSSVLQDDSLDAEGQLIHAERRELVAEAVDRLPSSLRSVLELRIRDGFSGKQIAQKVGISESAVKSRLLRACLLLRNSRKYRVQARRRAAAPQYGQSSVSG